MTKGMHEYIFKKHGGIPEADTDLLKAFREAGTMEEQLVYTMRINQGTTHGKKNDDSYKNSTENRRKRSSLKKRIGRTETNLLQTKTPLQILSKR